MDVTDEHRERACALAEQADPKSMAMADVPCVAGYLAAVERIAEHEDRPPDVWSTEPLGKENPNAWCAGVTEDGAVAIAVGREYETGSIEFSPQQTRARGYELLALADMAEAKGRSPFGAHVPLAQPSQEDLDEASREKADFGTYMRGVLIPRLREKGCSDDEISGALVMLGGSPLSVEERVDTNFTTDPAPAVPRAPLPGPQHVGPGEPFPTIRREERA